MSRQGSRRLFGCYLVGKDRAGDLRTRCVRLRAVEYSAVYSWATGTTMRLSFVAQGAYYVATGLTPLISRKAFERATGRKRDWWLVQMVGLLAVTVGSSLLVGACARSVTAETRALAILSAVSFA